MWKWYFQSFFGRLLDPFVDFGAFLALGFETEPKKSKKRVNLKVKFNISYQYHFAAFKSSWTNTNSWIILGGIKRKNVLKLLVPFGLPRPNSDLGFGTYGKPDFVVPLGRPRPRLTGASVDSVIASASSAIFSIFNYFLKKNLLLLLFFYEAK